MFSGGRYSIGGVGGGNAEEACMGSRPRRSKGESSLRVFSGGGIQWEVRGGNAEEACMGRQPRRGTDESSVRIFNRGGNSIGVRGGNAEEACMAWVGCYRGVRI